MFKLMESAALRIPLFFSAVLAACPPSPQDAAMPSPHPLPDVDVRSNDTTPIRDNVANASSVSQKTDKVGKAAQAPVLDSVAATGVLAKAMAPNSSLEALGRQILSTAFVRIGPDGYLTVELRDGRVLVLRDVVMRAKDYCGVEAAIGTPGTRLCGGYAEVLAARPGNF